MDFLGALARGCPPGISPSAFCSLHGSERGLCSAESMRFIGRVH